MYVNVKKRIAYLSEESETLSDSKLAKFLERRDGNGFSIYEEGVWDEAHLCEVCRDEKEGWYAYRRGRSKLRKITFGSNDNLTIERLIDAVEELIRTELSEEGGLQRYPN